MGAAPRGEGGVRAATIIVPITDDAGKTGEFVDRLDAALGAAPVELLFVDASADGMSRPIEAVAARSGRPVRLLNRSSSERVGGRAGAVIAGLRRARTDWAVVLDARHPPEAVPALLAATTDSVDVVVATPYRFQSGTGRLPACVRARHPAPSLAQRLFPNLPADSSDAVGSFFAIRRSAIDLETLEPLGLEILFEILAHAPGLRVVERSVTFGQRRSGERSASLRGAVQRVYHLIRLPFSTASSRRTLRRAAGFGVVGASGIVANTVALWLLVDGLGLHYLIGAVLATQFSSTWNFALTDSLVFRGPKRGSRFVRFIPFVLVNNATLLLRLPLLALLVAVLRTNYLVGNVLALLLLFVARFVACDRFIYGEGEPMTATSENHRRADRAPVDVVLDLTEGPLPTPPDGLVRRGKPVRRSPHYLPHRYDIHGLVRIGSEVPLRELEYFRVPPLQAGYDVEIRHGRLGTGALRRRAVVTQTTSPLGVRYEEHLGRFGADVEIDMGVPMKATIGPLLVRSPHVLYTNVVEPLLRFLLASRQHALLHAACLDIDGRGVLLSAKTDTGKTCTVLRLVRETGARFLSDDMTIMTPDGVALCYPKPLTISQHTLRAVMVDELSRSEWLRLRLQSRLHSKEGRAVGMRLGEMNVPIMALNAVTQWLVPPPKYMVERLLPCMICGSVQARELFVIERGAAAMTEIPPADLVDRLIENTDDAYCFPPYRYLAPALVIGGEGFEQLRARERSILEAAMSHVRAFRLAAEDFGWADSISRPGTSVGGGTLGDEKASARPVDEAERAGWPAAHKTTP